ncbi:MAG TPA: ATP-binding protein [Gaiellaceae bacterium]|nr:ATP-binding protein [Gaiellaceae bacterium]
MIRRLPIRLRVALPFAAAMALVLAGMAIFVYLRVGSALVASADQNLRAQLGELSGNVERGSGFADRDTAGAPTVGQLVRADGTVVRSTPGAMPALLSAARRREVLSGHTIHWNAHIPGLREVWRLVAQPVRTQQGGAALVAATSLAARDEALHRLSRELFLAVPLAVAIATLGGYLVAAAALRPVDAMRAHAADITASKPGRRLPVPEARDELSRLASTLNDMLIRLEAAFEHERRFVDDASHELRTPLTMLRTELELALRQKRSRAELESALQSAAEETEWLSRLADDLLLIARSDQGRLPVRPQQLDTRDVLDAVAERFDAAAAAHGRRIVVASAESIPVLADRMRLEQALGNLVANALRYGAGGVGLGAAVSDGTVELHVTDEGRGFAPEFIPRAFDRFSRAEGVRSTGGSGLGLAIVALIAEAHGGSAGVANRPSGGADAWIALPRR